VYETAPDEVLYTVTVPAPEHRESPLGETHRSGSAAVTLRGKLKRLEESIGGTAANKDEE
jgi:hypothetical protein